MAITPAVRQGAVRLSLGGLKGSGQSSPSSCPPQSADDDQVDGKKQQCRRWEIINSSEHEKKSRILSPYFQLPIALPPPLVLLSCINMYTTRHFSNPCLLVKLSKLIEIARKDRALDSLRKNIRIRDGLYRQWSKMATLLRRRSKKKKILALAGAKGRHKNMFSAVISTAVSLLVRVKENERKRISRSAKSRSGLVHSSLLTSGLFVFFIRILSRRPCTVLQ